MTLDVRAQRSKNIKCSLLDIYDIGLIQPIYNMYFTYGYKWLLVFFAQILMHDPS